MLAILLRKWWLWLLAGATLLVPPLVPVTPALETVIRISPEVRAIVHGLRRIDIPHRWRTANWTGWLGQGSCVHASMVHLFHWQGEHRLAHWWRSRYANGESPDGLTRKLDRAQIRYAETRSGDVSFLEWAIRTRRGAAVVVQNGAHMVNLVGLDEREARILDSNAPERVQSWPREAFVGEWRRSGGWAVTPLGPPPPPDPWIVR